MIAGTGELARSCVHARAAGTASRRWKKNKIHAKKRDTADGNRGRGTKGHNTDRRALPKTNRGRDSARTCADGMDSAQRHSADVAARILRLHNQLAPDEEAARSAIETGIRAQCEPRARVTIHCIEREILARLCTSSL